MITYTINRQPVYQAAYDGASNSAKLTAEIMERLVELDECEVRGAANLCRRLATLGDLSPSMFLTVLRLGSGDVSAVTQSFNEMAQGTGRTRQALHYEWVKECERIGLVFPALAALMVEYRQTIDHHEEPKSDADGLRTDQGGGAGE